MTEKPTSLSPVHAESRDGNVVVTLKDGTEREYEIASYGTLV
jgi:hypothetical protein